MKKIAFSILMAASSLFAAPQAVVFDWGNVIGFSDRSVVVNFLCDSFHLSESEFESINLKKKQAMKSGKSDTDFWLEFAQMNGIDLPKCWEEKYTAILRESVGADPNMYDLVEQLKDGGIQVGMLSNIDDRYVKLIRGFGFYEPFEPCLLSCEIGVEKPDLKAYELLIKTVNLPASEIVFIDDKKENVEAAKKMGIDALQFESTEQVRQELLKRDLLKE